MDKRIIKQRMKSALKVAATASLAYIAKEAADYVSPVIKSGISKKYSRSVEIPFSNEELYNNVVLYLKSFGVSSINNNIREETMAFKTIIDSDKSVIEAGLLNGDYLFTHNGCIWKVSDTSNIESHGRSGSIKISIIGKNSGIEHMNLIDNIRIEKYSNTITIKTFDSKVGRFAPTQILPSSFDDVISSINSDIIDILEKFKINGKYYSDRNLIHKIGILLYGEPGTGKTTIARAIAGYMGYNVASIKASDIDSRAAADISRFDNYVIVLEDIDCSLNSREEESMDNTDISNPLAMSLSQYLNSTSNLGDILNLLDGMNSPNNCIFIATTNYIDRLDPALIRAGRFDYRIELGKFDYDLAIKMCHRFDVGPEVLEGLELPINPSELQRHILEYRRKNNL